MIDERKMSEKKKSANKNRIPCRTIEKRKEKKKIAIKCGNKTSRAVNKE